MKKYINWLFYGLIIILFVLTIQKLDLNIFSIVEGFPIWRMLILIFLQCLSIVLIAHQWFTIVKKIKPKANFYKIIELNVIGTFTESITPAVKSGGEGVKLILLKKNFNLEYNQGLSVVLIQKFISVIVFVLYFIISFLCLDYKIPFNINTCFIVLLSLLALVILYVWLCPRKFKTKTNLFISKLKANLSKFSQERKLLLYLFLNNLIVWLGYPLKLYIISSAFGVELSFLQLAGIIFITYGVSMLPTTPGSIGTYEGTMTMLLAFHGVSMEIAISIAILTRFFTFWLVVLGSGLYLLLKKLLQKE